MKIKIIFLLIFLFAISSCTLFDNKDVDDISDWIKLPELGTVYSYYINQRFYDEYSYLYNEVIVLVKDSFFEIINDTLMINFDTIPCQSIIAKHYQEAYNETTLIFKDSCLYKTAIDTMFDIARYYLYDYESSSGLPSFELRCPIEIGNSWFLSSDYRCQIVDIGCSKEVLAGEFNDIILMYYYVGTKKEGEVYFSPELGTAVYTILDSFETRSTQESELIEIKR